MSVQRFLTSSSYYSQTRLLELSVYLHFMDGKVHLLCPGTRMAVTQTSAAVLPTRGSQMRCPASSGVPLPLPQHRVLSTTGSVICRVKYSTRVIFVHTLILREHLYFEI